MEQRRDENVVKKNSLFFLWQNVEMLNWADPIDDVICLSKNISNK